ncbi:hypothetical protein MMC27_008766 [Xylographa pallens]|nr:hypothetical protein [Xylographa pallens]
MLGAVCNSSQRYYFMIASKEIGARLARRQISLPGPHSNGSLYWIQTIGAGANIIRYYLVLEYFLYTPESTVMPFPYVSPTASVRPRRLRDKDKDIRYRSSSTSSRRSKDLAPLVDGRLLTHQPQTIQQSQHAVESATLDQLPPLPLSRTTSPCSATSSVFQSQAGLKTCETASQSYHIHTPASLQPYLEEDTDCNSLFNSRLADSQHGKRSHRYSPKGARRTLSPQSYPINPESPEDYKQLKAENAVASALSSETPQPTLQALSTVSSRAPIASQAMTDEGNQLDSQRVRHRTPSFNTYPIEESPLLGCPPSVHFHSTQFDDLTNDQQARTAQIVPYLAGYGYPTIMPINPDTVATLSHYGPNQASFAYEPLQPLRTLGYSNANAPGRDQDGGFSADCVQEDDVAALMYRIQSTMPDISLLMDRYRESLGQLAFQENRTRLVEAQKFEIVKQKEIYIDHLAKEMDSAAQKHLAETNKFRLEIGNLEEKYKEIQENLIASKDSKIELENGSEKQTSRVQKEHALKNQAMMADIDAMIKVEPAVETDSALFRRKHTEELESVKEKWSKERTDLEASHARERKTLEMVIQTCQERLKGASQRAQDEREKWSDERNRLQRDWNEQQQNLLVQHRNEMEELRKAGRSLYDSEQSRLEDKATRFQRQIETLKSGWDADKAKLAKAQNDYSARTSKLLSEIDRLQKMVDAFGEATDLSSRGNKYFTKAFRNLRTETIRLATNSCSGELADDLPTYVKDEIPANLPDFFAGSPSSIRLRASYIQYLICRTLNLRIFQPFLFTLDRRQEAANPLFEDWSYRLRKKSVKREATWRQHTFGEIKYFVCEDEGEAVQSALKRIVKLAVETQRHARLEEGMVRASMSFDTHSSMLDAGVSPRATTARGAQSDVKTTHILTTFPFIGKIQPEHNLDSDMHSETCIYSNGLALYQNSAIVLERSAELHQGRTNLDKSREIDPWLEPQETQPIDFGARSNIGEERSSRHTATSRPSTSDLSDKRILQLRRPQWKMYRTK